MKIIIVGTAFSGSWLLIHGVMGSSFFRALSDIAQKGIKVPSYEQVRKFFLGTMEAFIKLPQQYGKPVIASSFADRDDDAVKMAQDNGIPCFRAPERAVRAMAALCQYGEIRSSRRSDDPKRSG